MKRQFHILFLIVSLGMHLVSAGQVNGPLLKKRCPVKTINFESGLLNNGTTNIITDKLGFTWVSTLTGLQRYNGYSMQTIKPVVGKDTFRVKGEFTAKWFWEKQNGWKLKSIETVPK